MYSIIKTKYILSKTYFDVTADFRDIAKKAIKFSRIIIYFLNLKSTHKKYMFLRF